DDALTIPMDEVLRRREAELCLLLVVPGVGQVVEAADLDEAWVFDAAVLLVRGFGREDRLSAPREMDAVRALRVAETGRPVPVLRAVEHHELAVLLDDRRVEDAGRLEAVAGRTEDRIRVVESGPLRGRSGGERGRQQNCHRNGRSRREGYLRDRS